MNCIYAMFFFYCLTLSHMASKVARTIWHGGWRNTPKKTTLAIVKTILGASKPPAMPSPSEPVQYWSCCGDTSEPGGQGLKQSQQSSESFTFYLLKLLHSLRFFWDINNCKLCFCNIKHTPISTTNKEFNTLVHSQIFFLPAPVSVLVPYRHLVTPGI